MSQKTLYGHLTSEQPPLVLGRKAVAPVMGDIDFHEQAFAGDPVGYALAALGPSVKPVQQERVLYVLLKSSWAALVDEHRQVLERVVRVLARIIHPDRVLLIFLALRRVRANHKHASRAMLEFLANHPCLEDLALRRRQVVREVFEHALGVNTARGWVKSMIDEKQAPASLPRFRHDPERVRAVAPYVFKLHNPPSAPGQNYLREHTALHKKLSGLFEAASQPKTVTAMNRGRISATLVQIYRGGENRELLDALDQAVREEAAKLPFFQGRLALVLDASESTRGYGEREYCNVAQSVALTKVLERCCTECKVFMVGGNGDPPRPEGMTDMATALLDALEWSPDLAAIVTDGYENRLSGDLAQVVRGLREMGQPTPVCFCHSKFTAKDSLELRRPAPDMPETEFWHQADFKNVFLYLLGQVDTDLVKQSMAGQMQEHLRAYEQRIQT
jgi:hypothetical protein